MTSTTAPLSRACGEGSAGQPVLRRRCRAAMQLATSILRHARHAWRALSLKLTGITRMLARARASSSEPGRERTRPVGAAPPAVTALYSVRPGRESRRRGGRPEHFRRVPHARAAAFLPPILGGSSKHLLAAHSLSLPFLRRAVIGRATVAAETERSELLPQRGRSLEFWALAGMCLRFHTETKEQSGVSWKSSPFVGPGPQRVWRWKRGRATRLSPVLPAALPPTGFSPPTNLARESRRPLSLSGT